MTTRRNPEVEDFKHVLPRLINALPQKKKFLEYTVFYNWETIVGELIAKHVKPVRLSFHVLHLTADSPIWAQELDYMRFGIITKINAFVATELVKDVKFVPWSIEHATRSRDDGRGAGPESGKVRPPTATELSRAEQFCSRVRNPELRARITRATAQIWAKRNAKNEAQN